MASKIKIKRSSVAGKVPTSSDIDAGELAINIKDRKLYSSNGSSVFQLAASGGPVQYTSATIKDLASSDYVITGITSYANSVVDNSMLATKASWTALTSTNTALRTLISDRLQVANAVATYQTKAVERAALANTNASIATKVNTTTFNSALANTNTYIATRATWSALTATNTAIRTLVSDRLQVANATATYQTKAVERAALANTNASIATQTSRITLVNTNLTGTNTALRTLISDRLQVANASATYQTKAVERAALANTNSYIAAQATRITLVNTNLTGTNTAIRALDAQKLSVANATTLLAAKATWAGLTGTNTAIRAIVSDRLQVANASTLYATKTSPTTSGVLAHTGRATISTNLAVSGNATVSGTLSTSNFTAKQVGGDEGGQIDFELAATNTTLVGGVAIDIFQNKLRIFEKGGSVRGAYIDLTAATGGVGTNLLAGGTSGATWSALTSTNTALRTLISDRLQVANAVAVYQTKSVERAALANTNSYIASQASRITLVNTNLTGTNTAIRTLVSDRLQVANAAATYQTRAIERAALANTNSSIATQTSRITLVNTNLTGTNTALRTLISDRLQVANASTLYATKSNPTTSGLLAHTGRATISTNLAVSGNTILSGTLVANSSAGVAGYYLRSSGTGVYWSPVSASGGGANGFSGILVGANVVSADSTTDRLTLVAGSGIRLAANPTTDTITIATSVATTANVVTKTLNALLGTDTVVTSVNGVVVGGSAVGGGTDKVFYENDITITTNYTIGTNKNAMTAGPITINSGVTVTVPSGSVWSII